MAITGDESRMLASGDRQEIVVPRIARVVLGRGLCIRDDRRGYSQLPYQRRRVFRSDTRSDLPIVEGTAEFHEECRCDDKLEGAVEPGPYQTCRTAASRQKCGDNDIRVEDGPHAGSARPRCVLALERECHGLVLIKVRVGP